MSDKITQRIADELGVPALPDLLSIKLSGADLHSLLLSVIKRRVGTQTESSLKLTAASKASSIDGRLMHRVESLALQSAANFQCVELSPLMPLGAVTALTGLDQSNVLSTIRALECTSDPTVAMALEAAERRRATSSRTSVDKLCAMQRVVRFPMPTKPGFTAHFKLFSLVTAGRHSNQFEIDALNEQIGVYLALLESLSQAGIHCGNVKVEISHTPTVAYLCDKFGIDRELIRSEVRAKDSDSAQRVLSKYPNLWLQEDSSLSDAAGKIDEQVVQPLKKRGVDATFNLHRLTGLNYYQGACFHIKADNLEGATFMIADGGMVNWTQRLLTDAKERLMTSAIGVELLCRMFHQKDDER